MRITYRQLIRKTKFKLALSGYRLGSIIDNGKIQFYVIDGISGGIHSSCQTIEQIARTYGIIQEGEPIEIISPTSRT